MTTTIHPTAIVHKSAEIAEGVEIGPYSIIGPKVKIGDSCKIHSHVLMEGRLTIGKNNQFFSFASVGGPPQDLSYQGEDTQTEIGDGNTFREYVSVHRGTAKSSRLTRIGSHNFLMAYVHVGHDVALGNHCIIANSVNLAGHVKVGDRAIMGGGIQVSQFVSLGKGAYIGGDTAIDRDIPPYCTAMGNRVKLKGINIVGLRRNGHRREVIMEVVDFYRTMEASALSPRTFIEHEELMKDFEKNRVIGEIVEFVRESEIGIAPFIS